MSQYLGSSNIIRILSAVAALALAPAASAVMVTLEDRNSSTTFDLSSQLGQQDWVVDGVDQMAQGWFWYRVGGGGPESSLDTLSLVGFATTDTNTSVDSRKDTLAALYRHSSGAFEVEVTFKLRGGRSFSRESDVAEIIRIVNRTAAPLDFHFFQYVDFDLDGTPDFDSVFFEASNKVQQNGELSTVSETVVTPGPSAREVDEFPVTVGKLNDGVPTTLGNSLTMAEGDVTWAFQWDRVIAARGSFLISKNKQLTPEPGTCLLLVIGAAIVIRRRGSAERG